MLTITSFDTTCSSWIAYKQSTGQFDCRGDGTGVSGTFLHTFGY